MRIVRGVFVLLVGLSVLEMADSRGLVPNPSAVTGVAEAVRSLRSGDLDQGPWADLQKAVGDRADLNRPFRAVTDALE